MYYVLDAARITLTKSELPLQQIAYPGETMSLDERRTPVKERYPSHLAASLTPS
jgi:hypothetical protein